MLKLRANQSDGDKVRSKSARAHHVRIADFEKTEMDAKADVQEKRLFLEHLEKNHFDLKHYQDHGQYRDAELILKYKQDLQDLVVQIKSSIDHVWNGNEVKKTRIKNYFGSRTSKAIQEMATNNVKVEPKREGNRDHLMLKTEIGLQGKEIEKLLEEIDLLKGECFAFDTSVLKEELEYEQWATFSHLKALDGDALFLPPMFSQRTVAKSTPCSTSPTLPRLLRQKFNVLVSGPLL